MNGTTDLSYGRIYLDSNIVISLALGDAGIEVSQLLLDMVANVATSGRPPFGTSEFTLAESMVKAIRDGSESDARTFENLITTSAWLEVAAVDRNVLLWAAAARARYTHLKLPDAIHIASAFSLDCDCLLTADAGIRGTYEFDAPEWAVRPSSVSIAVIRPTIADLQSIVAWVKEQ